MREELREYARTRCAEQLRKERTYELPGHLRGEPVAVNATIGGKFDAGELRHLKPAPNGLFPWFDASDKMIWLTPRQVGSLATQMKWFRGAQFRRAANAAGDAPDCAVFAERGTRDPAVAHCGSELWSSPVVWTQRVDMFSQLVAS